MNREATAVPSSAENIGPRAWTVIRILPDGSYPAIFYSAVHKFIDYRMRTVGPQLWSHEVSLHIVAAFSLGILPSGILFR